MVLFSSLGSNINTFGSYNISKCLMFVVLYISRTCTTSYTKSDLGLIFSNLKQFIVVKFFVGETLCFTIKLDWALNLLAGL